MPRRELDQIMQTLFWSLWHVSPLFKLHYDSDSRGRRPLLYPTRHHRPISFDLTPLPSFGKGPLCRTHTTNIPPAPRNDLHSHMPNHEIGSNIHRFAAVLWIIPVRHCDHGVR